jgi:periplasmic protein TonB
MSTLLRLCMALVLGLAAGGGSAQDTEDPRVLSGSRIEYPTAARRNGLEGTVVLRVHVLESGVAESVLVQRSSGHSMLDAEALRFARSARFAPARREGQPVASWVNLPVRFQMEPGAAKE